MTDNRFIEINNPWTSDKEPVHLTFKNLDRDDIALGPNMAFEIDIDDDTEKLLIKRIPKSLTIDDRITEVFSELVELFKEKIQIEGKGYRFTGDELKRIILLARQSELNFKNTRIIGSTVEHNDYFRQSINSRLAAIIIHTLRISIDEEFSIEEAFSNELVH